jgi:cytoskeletal protein CcmA (bactofilin family)
MADGSTISSGTTIVGRVIAKSDLEIHGRIQGSVEASGDVTISSGAMLKSDVKAGRLHVAGAVAGNLHGEELLVLEEGSRVVGNVAAPTIGIRPGALIRGRVETSSSPPKASTPARRAPAKKLAAPKKGASQKKAPAKRRAPAPVMPKASKTATKRKKTTKAAPKAAAPKAAAKRRRAPAPVVPALKKRTKKASKRRAR